MLDKSVEDVVMVHAQQVDTGIDGLCRKLCILEPSGKKVSQRTKGGLDCGDL